MKKILILLISFFILENTTNASLLCVKNDFIIGRIAYVENNIIYLDNYINEKFFINSFDKIIDTRIGILNEKRGLLNKNILNFRKDECYHKSEGTKNIENGKIKLKNGDIVYMEKNIIDGKNNIPENDVNIIEKVICKNNKIYIGEKYNEKLDKKISGCGNLTAFFNQDRTFEDLEGNNLNLIYTKFYIKNYIKNNINFIEFILGIIFVLFMIIGYIKIGRKTSK